MVLASTLAVALLVPLPPTATTDLAHVSATHVEHGRSLLADEGLVELELVFENQRVLGGLVIAELVVLGALGVADVAVPGAGDETVQTLVLVVGGVAGLVVGDLVAVELSRPVLVIGVLTEGGSKGVRHRVVLHVVDVRVTKALPR